MSVIESPYVIDDRETPRFRVHRSTMVDPDILERERRLIFDRTWLYVGHESEIPEPHDFRTRSVGGRPIIFTRDADGATRVFVNSCPHRGMQIESRPEGHGRFLKCFYHGWSFNTSGDLVALPDEDSYGPDFDRHNLCLARPPRLDSYRGFVFLSWSADGPDLDQHLGAALDIFDLFADQSDDGMRVIGGTHVYSAKANWKLLAENSYDGYHALTTHHRYLAMLKESGKDLGLVFGGNGGKAALGWDLGNGHAMVGGADGTGGRNTGLGRDLPSDAALEAPDRPPRPRRGAVRGGLGQPDVRLPQPGGVPQPGHHRPHHGHHDPHLLSGQPRLHGGHGLEPAAGRRRSGAADACARRTS